MAKQLNQEKLARLAGKMNYRGGRKVDSEMMPGKRKLFNHYEEYDLIDIDKILRFYLVKQRDKTNALSNLVTLVNNIIENARQIN